MDDKNLDQVISDEPKQINIICTVWQYKETSSEG